jgi:hypothetical protein
VGIPTPLRKTACAAGTSTCQLYLLDLHVGWSLAQTAVAVRNAFKSKPITALTV